jgi:serine/threonine protein kinase
MDHIPERGGRALVPQDGLKAAIEEVVARALREVDNHELRAHSILYIRTKAGMLRPRIIDELLTWENFMLGLKTVQQLLGPKPVQVEGPSVEVETVPVSEIRFLKSFSSFRGGAMKVVTMDDRSTILVYKGFSFVDYKAYDHRTFWCHRDGIYREIEMLCKVLSPHVSIVPPPTTLVTIGRNSDGEALLCGALYPYHPNGSLANIIADAVEQNIRFPPQRLAKWCYQLASAVHHAHSVDGAWHQDLKTANILVDENDNLLLIDWEQCGANTFALAPEADGSFDLDLPIMYEAAAFGDKSDMLYVPYTGPFRQNNDIGAPMYVVFSEWMKQCPKAVELAEVWSLGSIMWQILEQVALEHLPDIEKAYDGIKEGVVWTEMSADLPARWRSLVDRCRKKDPNQRMRMVDVVEFWRSELERMESSRN